MELNQPSSSSSSSRHGRSQHNAELGQDDNPFVVPIRAPQSSQTSFNQLASARRVASQDLMYEEDNPFMHSRYKLSEESSGPAEVLGTASASASATSTPSRRFRTSAVPQVVDYDDLSFLDQNIFNGDSVSQRPTLSTPKRHAYSPHQPSLMSPSSIRHMNYHTVVTEPAPSAPKFLEKMTPVSPKEIERSSLKKEVVQIKVELKKWEAAFKKSRGRDATQDDIAKDPAMVRKYRDYSKLKKALAASKEPKDSKLTAGSVVNRPRTDSRSSPPTSLRLQSKTRPSELLRTPTKHSRTQHIAEDQLLRTPCLKLNQFAEESLVRTPGSRKGATEYVSPRHIGRHASLMSPGERDQYLSTPSLLRVGNLDISPSMQTSRVRLRSIGSTTPLQTYMFQVGQGIPEAPSERKSTHKLTSTTLLRSPIHGSPHFGGMNNRRKRAVPAHIFVQEDMSETQELQESQESKSLLDTKNVITSELTTAASETSEWMGDHNPLLKTPQKSGAAKAARALVRDALDLMTLEDLRDAASITYDDGGRWVDEDNSDITHENQSPVVLHSDYSSPVFDADALLSPSKSRARTEVLRTPSQQPSLTFSQITPGSARSEPDLFMVPPGFHSLYRRKPVRSSFFMTSQEDDAKFELEYNVGMQYCEQGSLDEDDTTINIMGFDDGHTGDSADQASSTLYSDDDGGRLDEGSVILKGVRTVNKHTKKKYTQKRTTRLHRIHVAHTEKAAQVRVSRRKVPERQEADSTKNSAEIDYAPDNFNLTEGDISVSQDNKDAERAKGTVSEKTSATTKFDPDSLSSGWANSNKPLVKSDRRYPGVGQGRAGAKRTSLNFATGISDGNYVAYNLQRGSFRKRGSGRGGRSRFSGTNFSNPTASTTGRSLFDNDSWRTDFDKDFDDRALVMSAIDNGLDLLADEDEDGLPWYGLVDDIFDPHVVTVSNKYLQKTVGELNDPDEFVKQLKMAQESQNLPHEAKGYEKDQGFKVNLLYILRNVWGHTSFRDGQLDSVKRSLRYQSSLLVLPTGEGREILSQRIESFIIG
ncbi:hypothetical protein BG004_005239 [Podila humilis]|nr:hypothetical protein BG004_005239 [Podila humilis]